MGNTKQNIIMIFPESLDGRMVGYMGHPALEKMTPNINSLAETGTVFKNAYCTHPICCPSRSNMWSGTYTHKCESWNNFKGLERGMWVFPEAVETTHNVCFLGKRDYYTGDHSVMNRVADFLEPLNVKQLPVMECDVSQANYVREDEDYRCHAKDWNYIDSAKKFLTQQKDEEKPFFMALNFGLVHAAFVTNKYWINTIEEKLVDIPAIDDSKHPAFVYQCKSKGWRYGFEEDEVRKVRRIYFAMIAELDAMVGEILTQLKGCGLSENTTVIFASDHGELALEHQQYYKMSMFEGSVRVPLIIAGNGVKSGQVIEAPASLIDIAPTLCELAKMPMRECFDGRSLMPVVRGEEEYQRDFAYSMYCGVTSNTNSYMLRTGEYKYIHHMNMPPQLFNIKNDPAELNDLATECPEIVAKLQHKLDGIVDITSTNERIEEYRKHNFKQFQRQAKQGLYVDNTYALKDNPSSDYREIMNNAFTGWSDDDEDRVFEWLSD